MQQPFLHRGSVTGAPDPAYWAVPFVRVAREGISTGARYRLAPSGDSLAATRGLLVSVMAVEFELGGLYTQERGLSNVLETTLSLLLPQRPDDGGQDDGRAAGQHRQVAAHPAQGRFASQGQIQGLGQVMGRQQSKSAL
jgi:hypothetical protein